MARGHVARSQDASGNIWGEHRMYQIEFAVGEVIELTTNVMAESMTPNVMQTRMSIYSWMC